MLWLSMEPSAIFATWLSPYVGISNRIPKMVAKDKKAMVESGHQNAWSQPPAVNIKFMF